MTDSSQRDHPSSMRRFTLSQALYALVLLTVGAGTWGIRGLGLGSLVLFFWASVTYRWWRYLAWYIVLLVALAITSVFHLFPPAQTPYWVHDRYECSNNLKAIVLGLHRYHEANGQLPPAYVTDDSGRRLHSWRVLVLPFMGYGGLYSRIRLDETWDSDHNRKLASEMPKEFRCPTCCRRSTFEERRCHANYFAILGPNTMWPEEGGRRFSENVDGNANTVLLFESHELDTVWMEPNDLSISEAVKALTTERIEVLPSHRPESFFYKSTGWRHLATVDGEIHTTRGVLSTANLRHVMTIDDGTLVTREELKERPAGRELRLENCVRSGLFVLVSMLPAFFVFRNRTNMLERR